ncbi:hypothetical protein ACHAWF_010675 [Thalassiosira exigua]
MCRKDNAEILSLTIKDELTNWLKKLGTNNLNFYLDDDGEIACTLGAYSPVKTNGQFTSTRANTYVVGDLAFYDMILDKESMSGHWCHLYQLSVKEFAAIDRVGEAWTYAEMERLATKFRADKDPKRKPSKGTKDSRWWTFIPLSHLICPLLHCLVGIVDNIFSKFCDEGEVFSTRTSTG